MNGFFSDTQVSYLRNFALRGMATQITIVRQRMVNDSSPYGDDLLVEETVGTAMGWIWSTPNRERQLEAGSLVTANVYRLYVPVGTDIQPADIIRSGDLSFIVVDTTSENTWKALLNVSLRRRE